MDDPAYEIPTRSGHELLALLDGQVAATPQRLAGLTVELVRELTSEDLLAAAEGQEILGPTSLGAIRHSHHRIAQLLCDGDSPTKVGFLTGYSPGYISRLQGDPAFKELLAYYASQAEAVHVDSLERLRQLGLHAMDELQERLETAPQEFTKKDLMEIVKQAVPAQQAGGSPGFTSGPAVALQVNFVTPPAADAPAPIVVDGKAVVKLAPEQEI